MTTIESLTLLLALIYSVSLLYHSGKKLGALITFVIIVCATLATLYWPMFIVLLVAVIGIVLLQKFAPQLATGQVRPNQLRSFIQHSLALSLFLVGIQFVINIIMLRFNMTPVLMRPDVGDAFLPIAGGIELKAIVTLGLWDTHHPAGAVMLVVVLSTGLLCKRAFCGWACPLGLMGEYIFSLRLKYFPVVKLPYKWLDYLLMSFKYLILIFLLFITLGMDKDSIPYYLHGNYHKIADIKMAWVFIKPSLITIVSLFIIAMLSAWRQRAFCRYICPYGALLGVLSLFSVFKIRRNKSSCLNEKDNMNCDKCTRACPANLIIHTTQTVRSVECHSCMRCVSACPSKNTLQLKSRFGWQLSSKNVVMILAFLLFFLPLCAFIGGFWHSETSDAIRIELFKVIEMISY